MGYLRVPLKGYYKGTIMGSSKGLYKSLKFLQIRGTLVWGPQNRDPTIQGTVLGSPIFGNPPMTGILSLPSSASFKGSFKGSFQDLRFIVSV